MAKIMLAATPAQRKIITDGLINYAAMVGGTATGQATAEQQ